MPAPSPSTFFRTAASLALCSTAGFVACSLMAPSDDFFLRETSLPRAEGGESAGGSVTDGGASGEQAGMGGEGGRGEGQGGAVGGSGGEAGGSCEGDLREDAGGCVSVSGCSDGSREAFLPVTAWPNLAGCTARWPLASLRDQKTGARCGFELGVCAVPADACGEGWHVCAAPPYGPEEVSSQATAEDCASQPGAYVAAVGDQFCEPCSDVGDGAACCGERCVQQHGNCIYPGQTAWFGLYEDFKNVCGAIKSDLVQRGVMCCRD